MFGGGLIVVVLLFEAVRDREGEPTTASGTTLPFALDCCGEFGTPRPPTFGQPAAFLLELQTVILRYFFGNGCILHFLSEEYQVSIYLMESGGGHQECDYPAVRSLSTLKAIIWDVL